MVDYISMFFSNGLKESKNIMIVPKDNVCFINNKKFNIDDDCIKKIIDILVTWNYEYGYSNVLDCQEFRIDVFSKGIKTTYHGKGIFPSTYDYLLSVLGEIENE